MDEYSGDVLGTSVFSIVHGCSYFSGVTGLTVCPRYREVLYSLECIIKSFTVIAILFVTYNCVYIPSLWSSNVSKLCGGLCIIPRQLFFHGSCMCLSAQLKHAGKNCTHTFVKQLYIAGIIGGMMVYSANSNSHNWTLIFSANEKQKWPLSTSCWSDIIIRKRVFRGVIKCPTTSTMLDALPSTFAK